MIRPLLYCILLLCLFVQKTGAQTFDTQPGVFYLKLKPAQAFSDQKTHLFSFSDLRDLKRYEPLKKTGSGSREKPSVLDGLYKVYVDEATDIPTLCSELSALANVTYAEPVAREQLLYVPNDPEASTANQDYLGVISAFEAWDITQGSSEIVIGIIDTGLDLKHPDIEPKLYTNSNDPPNGLDDDGNGFIDDFRGYDLADGDSIPQCDDSYHGNRVGGLAGAATDNGFGMAGVGFNTLISPLKVYSTISKSITTGYEAVLYAADNGYDVINLSWGSANTYSQANQDIITYAALEKNVVIVAAAGNTPEEDKFYPASYDHVLSVAASNINDTKASFSTYNYAVDLIAPGNAIYSTNSSEGFAKDNGTSYSAPMVAGAAALVKSQFPTYNALQIMEQVRVTTDDVYELEANGQYLGKLGHGRLNVASAVANDSARSVRLENISYSNAQGTYAFQGDTIRLSFDVVNYLSPTQMAVLRFSSTSEYVSFLPDSITIGPLQSLERRSISEKIFVLADDTPPETSLAIRVDISDTDYSDFQYIELATNEDRLDLNNGRVLLTLTGNGNLGYGEDGYINGLGLKWKDHLVAARLGLMIVQDSNSISDNLPITPLGSTRKKDFQTITPMKFGQNNTTDLQATNTFDGFLGEDPLQLIIDQSTLTNQNADYFIQEYRLTNTTPEKVDSIRLGLFVDWNLPDAMHNRALYDRFSGTLIAYNEDSSSIAGMRTYFDRYAYPQSIDLDAFEGNAPDLPDSLTDSIKYALATAAVLDSAGWAGAGNNIAALLTHDSISIEAHSSAKATFLIGFGESLEALQQALDEADSLYTAHLNSPALLERFTSCEGGSVNLDPAGNLYRFYSDPLGENLLSEGNTLETGAIHQDTSFYVVNLDGSYPTDIQRIDISLIDEVANFEMSTDTLFLDQQVNTVSFTDMSFQASSWLWVFGNGSQATIQNPTIHFTVPGSYEVSLFVQTESGCADTTTQTLLVAQRPPLPDISDQVICSGAPFSLQAANAESIALYLSPEAESPLLEGAAIQLDDIHEDTVFFITNTTGPFESLKKQVLITINDANGDFYYVPDTSTVDTGAVFINATPNTHSVTWYVDGAVRSQSDSLLLSIEKANYVIAMHVVNQTGCTDSIFRAINLQASPIPVVDIEMPCAGDAYTITPQNGTFFGFYEDQALNVLLQKGHAYTLESIMEATTLHVVGLDSILPSAPLAVQVAPDRPAFEIVPTPDTLYLSEQLTALFETNTSDLVSWKWYVDGIFTETAATPTLFFDQADTIEIVLQGQNSRGCTNADTLSYIVLETRPVPPLGIPSNVPLLYPNPTTGVLFIDTPEPCRIEVMDLTGKTLQVAKVDSGDVSIDLSGLPKGMYLLRVTGAQGSITTRIQLQ